MGSTVRIRPQTQRDLAAQRHRIDHDHPRPHADGRGRRHQADRAAAGHHHGIGGVHPAMSQHGIVAAGEGLDQRALGVIDRVGQLVQPFRAGARSIRGPHRPSKSRNGGFARAC